MSEYEKVSASNANADSSRSTNQPRPKRSGESAGKPGVGGARGKSTKAIKARITNRYVWGDRQRTVVTLGRGSEHGVRIGMKVMVGKDEGSVFEVDGYTCKAAVDAPLQDTLGHREATINP